jgi:hypothetical protein
MAHVRSPARSIRTLLLSLVTMSSLWAAAGVAAPSDARATAASWELGPVQWDASEVTPGERSLLVAYQGDSCGERNARATVQETRTSLTIAVLRETAVYEGVISCPAPRLEFLTVPLQSALAGRLVLGRSPETLNDPRAVFGTLGNANETVRVPRLVGFAPIDADYALAFEYLRDRVLVAQHGERRGLSHVIAQVPAAGRIVSKGTVVRLLVAR